MSNDAPNMAQYVNKNQAGFYAWGEGLASMMGMYAPVAKQVRVLPFLNGDNAYAVQVNGHFRAEPAGCEMCSSARTRPSTPPSSCTATA